MYENIVQDSRATVNLQLAYERWIPGRDERYAVTTTGEFISYASRKRYYPRTVIRRGAKYVRVFIEDEVKDWRVGDLVAQVFLGSLDYVYKDGDRTNTALDNLQLKDDTLLADEVWVKGYEQEYSIRRSGEIMSFKHNLRTPLKLSTSLGRSLRACLTGRNGQETVYVDTILASHFELH